MKEDTAEPEIKSEEAVVKQEQDKENPIDET